MLRKISSVAVAGTLLATAFGVWAAAPTSAPADPASGPRLDPFQLMVTAKGVPTADFADYTFVFN